MSKSKKSPAATSLSCASPQPTKLKSTLPTVPSLGYSVCDSRIVININDFKSYRDGIMTLVNIIIGLRNSGIVKLVKIGIIDYDGTVTLFAYISSSDLYIKYYVVQKVSEERATLSPIFTVWDGKKNIIIVFFPAHCYIT